jgi:dolichol-phosphate mannosyltransferase
MIQVVSDSTIAPRSLSPLPDRLAAPVRPLYVRVVLPAYNEEQTLDPLLRSLREAMEEDGIAYEVLVVNDGSTDRTSEVAEAHAAVMPVKVVQHPVNKGLPEAIKTGLFTAAEISDERDVIIVMDADNSHTPGLILRMTRMIKEGSSIVIASRYREGSRTRGLSTTRRVLSWGANLLFRIFLPIEGVRDYSCGYRAYRASVLKEAIARHGDNLVSQPGFSCMIDLLLKLRELDPIVTEVPMILRYDLKTSSSKMNVGGNVRETLGLLVKRTLRLGG